MDQRPEAWYGAEKRVAHPAERRRRYRRPLDKLKRRLWHALVGFLMLASSGITYGVMDWLWDKERDYWSVWVSGVLKRHDCPTAKAASFTVSDPGETMLILGKRVPLSSIRLVE